MEIIAAIIIFFVVGAILMGRKNKPAASSGRSSINSSKRTSDDYEIWVSIIKERKSNIHEFSLFGTKAAILWDKEQPEAEIVCITSFVNKSPETKKWDHFAFNIREKYWSGTKPKGAAAEIREELKNIGLI